MSYGRKKKERRTKQSLDSPQTIEANNNNYFFTIQKLDSKFQRKSRTQKSLIRSSIRSSKNVLQILYFIDLCPRIRSTLYFTISALNKSRGGLESGKSQENNYHQSTFNNCRH